MKVEYVTPLLTGEDMVVVGLVCVGGAFLALIVCWAVEEVKARRK